MRLLNKDLRLQDVTLMYLTVLATVVVLLVASYQAPALPSRPPLAYHIPLDPSGQLELSWNISYPTQEVYLEVKVKELHHGLLLGMSDRGEPTNADLVILWDDGQKSYFGVRIVHMLWFYDVFFFMVLEMCSGDSVGLCAFMKYVFEMSRKMMQHYAESCQYECFSFFGKRIVQPQIKCCHLYSPTM